MRSLRSVNAHHGVARLAAMTLIAALVSVTNLLVSGSAAAAQPCDAPVVNKVACENTLPGNPGWIVAAIDDSIVGFTDDISYSPGNTVNFKIKTDASSYKVDIYRLGYYNNAGARLVSTVWRNSRQTQPRCLDTDPTGLIDCGNWATSVSYTLPATAVSGIYYAVVHRPDTLGESEVVFVVRDDAGRSDILFQTSDATWQAYNTYGNGTDNPKGNSLYTGTGPGNGGSAYKVSYNRPIVGGETENFIFNAEYPMLKFLERNGYDISYTTNVDTARRGGLIKNHKVFMPVGHDEYWSNEQRANVEAARASGVNMAFLSGNDIFWKTRWEPSTDTTRTSWRTLVCYKETKAGQVDPHPAEWTGTWRDPRNTAKDGGRPENALLGQIFTVNGVRKDSLSVPSAYGKMRLWRNTPLAGIAANTSYTFQPGTLGYEWDSVEENGFQPPGVAQMSRTSVTMSQPSDTYVLQNYGDQYGPGTKTHALTMYRYQPSGALVFAAGTVQWAWGLENEHLFATGTPTADVRMQQAAVNFLADMGVQPRTIQPGLVLATASTDTAAPMVTINPGPDPVVGTATTITGSVTDLSGRVAGVEVSLDGTTWRSANWQAGASTWTHTFTPSSSGPLTVQVRAVDDSANLSTPVSRGMTANARACPCSIWSDTATPAVPATNDSSALELGVKFQAQSSGYVRGVKFYRGSGNTGTHTGSLWKGDGTLLATGTFTGETVQGWQTLMFPSSVPITSNTTYIASYHTNTGRYAADAGYFTNSATGLEPLKALQSTTTSPNGVYKVGASGFPDRSFGDANYWVDVVYGYDPGPDTRAPLVVSTNPVANGGSVALNVSPSVTFDEAIAPSSLLFTVSGPSGNVPGGMSLSSDGRVATFTPSQTWAAGTTFTASVRAYDMAGNSIPSPPYTWSFTTGRPRPASCPCTIWDDFIAPVTASANDAFAIELGTKVRFDSRGSVLGIRFYKGQGNTGTHTGSLWTSTGTRLATGTFTGETGGGWQTLTFASPVSVQSGTTYVISYYAPNGGYAATGGYFNGGTVNYGAMNALGNGIDGGNGVYRYGSGGGFPTSSYNGANYWVDVIWQQGANGDSTPPFVVSTVPAASASGVSLTAPVTATFNEAVDLATTQFSLADPGGAKLTGTLSRSGDGKTVSWTPAARLAAGTTYRASIRIADLNGNLMSSPATWSFTAATTQTCPCSLFSGATLPTVAEANDTGSYELGVRFTTSVDGFVTGVKFYKGTSNTGTHTGSLWTASGQLLASGTFTGETATGWQTLTFSTPVAVQAGQSYVASYTTPNGRYAADGGYFQRTAVVSSPLSAPATGPGTPNGVYKAGPGFPASTYQGGNYWVDVVFAQ